MNYKMIRYTLGLIMLFEGAFFIIPTITALIYSEFNELLCFAITLGVCVALGFLMSAKKPDNMKFYTKEGFVIVSLCWIILSIFGSIPFYISGAIPNFIDALFETVSGFTTTGSSIIQNVELMPKSILIWRSFTHWVGGMGVLVFVMAVLPLSGAQNMHIMKAESPGPQVSKLVPRVRTTALILYLIYFSLTVLEFILLLFDGGVSVFEAICTAFGTAGTGGFGIKADSMNSYSSYVQIVCTVFMLIFSVNFNAYYLIIKGKIKDAINTEIKVFFVIVAVAIAAISLNIYFTNSESFDSVFDLIKHVSFTVASLISTTGFSTVDFSFWPALSRGLILILMFVGACAGSTGGGLKVSRILLLGKSLGRETRTLLHPKQIKTITMDKTPVSDTVIRSVSAYMVAYAVIFIASMLLLSVDPYVASADTMMAGISESSIYTGNAAFVTNFTSVVATINNIGPGMALTGPCQNFAFFSPFSKIVLIFDMLIGRLEIFPILLLFTPATWKKIKKEASSSSKT